MKQTKRDKIPVFTTDDHLRVQQQIEKRAYEIWQARCPQQDTALDDWVRAEHEVLEDCIIRRQSSL
jgi:hypothetical protein